MTEEQKEYLCDNICRWPYECNNEDELADHCKDCPVGNEDELADHCKDCLVGNKEKKYIVTLANLGCGPDDWTIIVADTPREAAEKAGHSNVGFEVTAVAEVIDPAMWL